MRKCVTHQGKENSLAKEEKKSNKIRDKKTNTVMREKKEKENERRKI